MTIFYKIRGYPEDYVFEMDHSFSKKKWILALSRNKAQIADDQMLSGLELQKIPEKDVLVKMQNFVLKLEHAIRNQRSEKNNLSKDGIGSIVASFGRNYRKSMESINETVDEENNSSNGVTVTNDDLEIRYSLNHYDNVISIEFFDVDASTGKAIDLNNKNVILLSDVSDSQTGASLKKGTVLNLMNMGEMWFAFPVYNGKKSGEYEMIFKSTLKLNNNMRLYDEKTVVEKKYWE